MRKAGGPRTSIARLLAQAVLQARLIYTPKEVPFQSLTLRPPSEIMHCNYACFNPKMTKTNFKNSIQFLLFTIMDCDRLEAINRVTMRAVAGLPRMTPQPKLQAEA